MELKELERHLLTLATLPQTGAPFISCYLNLELGSPAYHQALDERARVVRRTLAGRSRRQFEEALGQIESYLRHDIHAGAAGVAIFACAEEQPFFLPLQFAVPLPNWVVVDVVPNIYHLLELKDTYDRYVVLFCAETWARVLGLNLGRAIEDIRKELRQLHDRPDRDSTRDRYRNLRQQQTHQFINDLIRIVNQMMSAGGYAHLVLAGHHNILSQVRNALPTHLEAKVVDIIPATEYDRVKDVIAATLVSFVEQEERESQAVAERLQREVNTNGLAVTGTHASFEALRRGQVDTLVVAKAYEPGIGWTCRDCEAAGVGAPTSARCSQCHSTRIRKFNVKEEMARMAEATGSAVEVVNHSEALMRVGGVGCLLRFAGPEKYSAKAA